MTFTVSENSKIHNELNFISMFTLVSDFIDELYAGFILHKKLINKLNFPNE